MNGPVCLSDRDRDKVDRLSCVWYRDQSECRVNPVMNLRVLYKRRCVCVCVCVCVLNIWAPVWFSRMSCSLKLRRSLYVL